MNKLLCALLMCFSLLANATGKEPEKNKTNPSSAVSNSKSEVEIGDVSAKSSVGNVSGGGASIVNKESISTVLENNESRNPVNSAYAPSVYSTNQCTGSTTLGGQGITVGFSFGTTWTDKDCALMKVASDFEQAGYKHDALVIRCQSTLAELAPSCKALK